MRPVKYIRHTIVLGLLLLLAAVAINYRKLNIISGYAAKNMASSVFIAGRTSDDISLHDNNVPLIRWADTEFSGASKQAKASVFGLMERRAVCREGLGCVLLVSGEERTGHHLQPHRATPGGYPSVPDRDADTLFPEIDYGLLNKAVDNAFKHAETAKTRTVLVIYKDRIIAERYLAGFTEETPILGWSMTKSVLATLYGILEYRGTIALENRVPVPEWQGDMRKQITYDDLLRMQSGLAWDENYNTISDVTRMLFMEADMTQAQKRKEPLAPPGEIWNYSSGTSNLLSGLLRRNFKTHQEYLDFPYEALIDRIGMHSMVLEADMAGNYVGSSYCWANTRDWARLGSLYLHQGNWKGEQLFSPSWTAYVSCPTKDSHVAYGAHFWLNAGGKYPGAPEDMFSANGYQGQYLFIIPSRDLVIVRTGLAEPPDFNVNAFLRDIVNAVRQYGQEPGELMNKNPK